MQNSRLFIYTKNSDFGKRLAEYIANRPELLFCVERLTDITEKTGIEEGDYLITDAEEEEILPACHKIMLVKARPGAMLRSGRNNGQTEETSVFMYQSGSQMVKELLAATGTVNDSGGEKEVMAAKKEHKLIGFFAPDGGGGRTVSALRRAAELAVKEAVLYLSFCEFPVLFQEELSEEPEWKRAGLSELMLCRGEEIFEEKLEELSFLAGRIYVLAPVRHYRDLLDFSPGDIKEFLASLRKQTRFPKVVIELGELFEYTMDLLAEMDEAVVLEGDGTLSRIRRHVLRRYCLMEGQEELWQRVQFRKLPDSGARNLEQLKELLEGGSGA